MISIPYLICSILSFVPAIVCHEACHGFAAYKLGDPTAKRAGRLSFNPRKGDLIVGLAGPAANLVLAVLGAVVYTLVMLVLPVSALAQNDVFYYFLTLFLPMFSLINLYLMFFNLLPIPPLDGSSIFAFFLPQKYLPQYYKVQRYAMPVFLVAVLLVPYVLHFNPIGIYLDVTAGNVFDLLFSFGR